MAQIFRVSWARSRLEQWPAPWPSSVIRSGPDSGENARRPNDETRGLPSDEPFAIPATPARPRSSYESSRLRRNKVSTVRAGSNHEQALAPAVARPDETRRSLKSPQPGHEKEVIHPPGRTAARTAPVGEWAFQGQVWSVARAFPRSTLGRTGRRMGRQAARSGAQNPPA